MGCRDKTFPSALGKSHSLRDTIVWKVMRFVLYKWKSLVSHMCVRENVMCLYQLPREYGSLKSNLLSQFVGLSSCGRYYLHFFIQGCVGRHLYMAQS